MHKNEKILHGRRRYNNNSALNYRFLSRADASRSILSFVSSIQMTSIAILRLAVISLGFVAVRSESEIPIGECAMKNEHQLRLSRRLVRR